MPQTRTHLILTSTHFTDEETKGQRSQLPKVIQPLGSSVWQTPGLRDCPHLQLRSEVPILLREPPMSPRIPPTGNQVSCSLAEVYLPGRASASPAHPCARDRRGTLCAICLTLQKALRFTMCMRLIASWRSSRSLSASPALAGGCPPTPPLKEHQSRLPRPLVRVLLH